MGEEKFTIQKEEELKQWYEEVISCSDKIIELNPKDVTAWYRKGDVSYKLGKYQEAIICYDKVIEIGINSKDVIDVWYYKGNALEISRSDYLF